MNLRLMVYYLVYHVFYSIFDNPNLPAMWHWHSDRIWSDTHANAAIEYYSLLKSNTNAPLQYLL